MFTSKQWRERKQEERPTGRQPSAEGDVKTRAEDIP